MILSCFWDIFDQFYTTEASFEHYLMQFAPKIGELYGPDPEGTSAGGVITRWSPLGEPLEKTGQ